MKTPPLRWLGFTAAAAAAVLCWHLLTGEPDVPARPAGKAPARAAQVTGKGVPSLPAEPQRKPVTPEVKFPAAGPRPAWLDLQGRDAAGLITAWDMSHDEKLLMEAAKRFPGDPRVCSAMIEHSGDNPQKALPWIERLIAGEPDNPQGLYHKARALLAGKDRAGAIAVLRQAAAMPGPRDTHLPGRMLALRDAAIAGAATRGDAARQALTFMQRHSSASSYSLSGPSNAIGEELENARVSGREDRLMEITGIGLATAEKFSSGGGLFLWDAIEARKLAHSMLMALPDDTEIGGGRTYGRLHESGKPASKR